MSTPPDIGKKGEELAREHLIAKGYKILETNWRAGHLEVDMIGEHEDYLCIIEVKSRSTGYLVEPEFAVNKSKQSLLIRAANAYIARTGTNKEVRFDIVSVVFGRHETKVELIQNAFYPTR
jgi:putative endonuclease